MIRIISRELEFLQLREDWDRLFDEGDYRSYYQTFGCAFAVWNEVEKRRSRALHILVDEVDGRVLLIAPLVKRRVGPWTVLQPLGATVSFTCDIMTYTTYDVMPIWHALRRSRCSALCLELVRQDAKWWHLLTCNKPVGTLQLDAALFLDLSRWAHFGAYNSDRPKQPPLSKTKWNSLRYAHAHLAKLGEVKFSAHLNGEQFDDIIGWIFAFKEQWLEERSLNAPPGTRESILASARQALRTGNLMLCELRVGPARIAATLSFVTGGRLDFCMVALDYAWRKGSPGKIIVNEMIRWGFENNIDTFDFGTGLQPYKFLFTDTYAPILRAVCVPLSAAGITYKMVRETRRQVEWIRNFYRSALARVQRHRSQIVGQEITLARQQK